MCETETYHLYSVSVTRENGAIITDVIDATSREMAIREFREIYPDAISIDAELRD